MDVEGLIHLTNQQENNWKTKDPAGYQSAIESGVYIEKDNDLYDYDVLPGFLKNTIPNPGEGFDISLHPSEGEAGEAGEVDSILY